MYQVRNVTTNTSYGSSACIACNETVKYYVQVVNTEFGKLTNVNVKANLNGTATASATNSVNEATTATSNSVAVTVPKGTLAYVSGSTQLYDDQGKFIKNLPDGVAANGVNAGDLGGSTRELIYFQATVSCPTTPPVTPPVTPPTTPPVTPPTELPHTGIAANILGLVGLGSVIAAAAYFIASRRALRS